MDELHRSGKTIADLAKEVAEFENAKKVAVSQLLKLNEERSSLSEAEYVARHEYITGGLAEDVFVQSYDEHIALLKEQIRNESKSAKESLQKNKPLPTKPSAVFSGKTGKKAFASDVDRETFVRFVNEKRKGKKEQGPIIKYTLYESSKYGAIANRFFGNLSLNLVKKYPHFFDEMFVAMKSADFRILSKTYVSMMIFTSLLAAIVSVLLGLIIFSGSLMGVVNSFLGALLIMMAVFVGMYYYPQMVVGKKRSEMKADLPFVAVHMAAVAGSGAQPVSMFTLVLNAGEYKGLEPEIKKILNYVNLFGYDLTTSLRLVASTTPLRPFADLLSGIVTTLETGGDLKVYLDIKAKEIMQAYESERKQFTDTLATFSDIYIGISLAAPMMLFVLLTIINTPILGGKIGGITAGALATLGTFIVIPIMNVIFIILVDVIQPK